MSKIKFKKIVKEAVQKSALCYLHKMKSEQSKVKHLNFTHLNMADYLQPNELDFSNDVACFLAKLQTRMVKVKCNFKNMHLDLICKTCMKSECTQEHLLYCEPLLGKNELVSYIPEYNEIWNGNIGEKLYIAQIMYENYKLKMAIENEDCLIVK